MSLGADGHPSDVLKGVLMTTTDDDCEELWSFFAPHIALGATARLTGHAEQIGRWPSLVVDTGRFTVQVDLQPALAPQRALAVVQELAAAVAEWEQAVIGAAAS